MIVSFQHKGLEAFYRTGSKAGIQPKHANKLANILANMDAAISASDLDLPGYRLHALSGDLTGFWSLTVNGNWRVIFRMIDTDMELVDYLDYH